MIKINKVVLIGRLTRDPELRFTEGKGTAVTKITLAVDRYNPTSKENEADFIPIVIWGKQAEATANYMRKGKLMGVSGRMQTRSYDSKDGTKKYVTEVVADETQFLEWGQPSGASSNNNFNEPDMTQIDDDGSIPF